MQVNIVEALKKVKNDLLNFTVNNLNNKADVDHSHSYNDLTDLPIGNVSDDSGALQAFQNKVNSHINDTNIHVVLDDKAKWNNKVDKEDGKGLSSNDFTDDAVNLLSALLEYESYDKNRSENIAHFKKILFENHKPIYESVDTEPTCSKRGYTTHTCYCGCSHMDNYTPALGHDWGEYVDMGSYYIRTCVRCGDSYIDNDIKIYSIGDTVYGPDDVDVIRSLYLAPDNGDWVKVLDENGQPQTNEDGDFLWIIEEVKNGTLTVYVEFEDGVIPDDLDMIPLIITRPDGEPEPSKLNKYVPRFRLRDVPLGTYSVQEVISEMQIDGYDLTVTYMAHLEGEDPAVGNTVTLTKENLQGYITITNRYYTEHTHEYTSNVTEPTCTEQGYTTYTCSICGDSYKSDYVDALGHDYGERVEGDYGDVETCNRCGDQIKYFGRLSLYVEFEGDIDTEDLPTPLINVTFPDMGVEGVFMQPNRPQIRLIRIPLGQYFIESNIEDCGIEGYNVEVKYAVSYDGTNYTDAQSAKYTSVMLTDENMIAHVKVIHCYTPIAEE